MLSMSERKRFILDKINNPSDLKTLGVSELVSLAEELREEVIEVVSVTGGHLGASLGVIELTIALHYVFEAPKDDIIWDVGHQAYPHKILTGRRKLMKTLRQPSGLSGFTKRSESEYDSFGAGHSSTSLSAALGMSIAKRFAKNDSHVVAVIGDGAISAGMAYEAMNNAASVDSNMIIILNDNEMSIAPAVGAMSKYLCKMVSSKAYLDASKIAKGLLSFMPKPVGSLAKKAKKYVQDFTTGGNFFEEMGFEYFGPIDGHDIKQLVKIFANIKQYYNKKKPVLLHVRTEKGRGFLSPEASGESYHAVKQFDFNTKIQKKSQSNCKSYTQAYAESLIKLAKNDEKILGITAAMPSGTGMNMFYDQFPDRMFDVGIAEQHAVTFAAGLAAKGFKPFVSIYSTFLQRAYDQIVHDVAIQNLPVRFAIDRAGLVGSDGPTHAGSFDIAYLANLPNFIVLAPSDSSELVKMVKFAYEMDNHPCAFRFPRGEVFELKQHKNDKPLILGKGRIIFEGERVAILSIGTRLEEAIKAREIISKKHNISITIADARFIKPLDGKLITKLAKKHEVFITIEEGAIGGFGSHVADFLHKNKLLDNNLKFHSMFLPDKFIEHNKPFTMYEKAGLNSTSIVKCIEGLLNY